MLNTFFIFWIMCRARKFHLIGSLDEQCVSDPPPAPVWPNLLIHFTLVLVITGS